MSDFRPLDELHQQQTESMLRTLPTGPPPALRDALLVACGEARGRAAVQRVSYRRLASVVTAVFLAFWAGRSIPGPTRDEPQVATHAIQDLHRPENQIEAAPHVAASADYPSVLAPQSGQLTARSYAPAMQASHDQDIVSVRVASAGWGEGHVTHMAQRAIFNELLP